MVCVFCGGTVRWMGPLAALTHTQCENCGRTNCQEPESEPDAGDDPGEDDFEAAL